MGVLSWVGFPKFSAPLGGETVRRTPKVLAVQERAEGPLSLCQAWCVSDFTSHRGKNVEFFVCLSVRQAMNVTVCAHDFAMNALEYRNDFDAVG